MADLFWYGVVAGFGLAIPIGPMAILLITTTLQRGFKFGAVAGLGMMSVDFIYALVTFALGKALLTFLSQWGAILSALGALILLLFGVRLLISSWKLQPGAALGVSNGSLVVTYRNFVAATFINPATAFYFLAITASLGEAANSSTADFWSGALSFSIGVLLASGLWQETLAIASGALKRGVTFAMQRWIGVAGGLLVIALALNLGWRSFAN